MMQNNVWRRLSAALVMACMLMVALPAAAQDSPVQIECGSTVASLGLVDAESALLACPADCAIAAVWGTDIYTDDSDICAAARHAGVIDVRGGQFRLLLLPGETSYEASAQNGVTSDSWGAWERSIRFEATEATGMLTLDCETRADALDLAVGEAMDVTCPAGCDTGRLWGTDIYTADSTVCWAAQHAGVIRIEGGSFTVTALGPQQEFAGSTQNGVTSASWTSYDASFEVAALAPEVTPEVTPEATASCDTEVVCDAPAELGGGLGLPGAPFIYINPDDSSIFTAALPQGWTALTEEGKAPVLTSSPEAGARFDAGEIPPDSMAVQVQVPSSLVANLNIDPSLRGDAVIDAVIAALGPGFGEPFKLPDLPIAHRMVQVADASLLPEGVQGAVLVAQIDGDVLAFVILYSVDDTAMTDILVPLVMSATYLPG